MLGLLALLLAVALSCLPVNSARAADGTVSFLRRDYTLQIQRNGDVAVSEQWQVQFSGGPFTGATLGVFLTYCDSVDFQAIQGADTNSEQVTRVTDSAGHGVMQIAWTFPAAQDTTRSFTISYTLHGAIGLNATQAWLDRHFFDGPGHSAFAVAATKVMVTLPSPATSAPQVKATYPSAQLQTSQPDASTVVVAGQNLNSGNLLEAEVIFPRGLLDDSAKRPAWQQGDTPPPPPTSLTVAPGVVTSTPTESSDPLSALFDNVGLVLALGLALLAILLLVAWWLARRLGANIRELQQLRTGAPVPGSAGVSLDTKPLPAIDLDFGEVEWPSRHEEPDLAALGLHPLEESPPADDAAGAAPVPDAGEPKAGDRSGDADDGGESRGTGAISGVGSNEDD